MKPDPRTLYDLIRDGDVERVGKALEPQRRGGMHHVSRPVNSIREKVVAQRAAGFFPHDAEAQAGYRAYHRGLPATSNPFKSPLDDEDRRGWSKGWWKAKYEAEGGPTAEEPA